MPSAACFGRWAYGLSWAAALPMICPVPHVLLAEQTVTPPTARTGKRPMDRPPTQKNGKVVSHTTPVGNPYIPARYCTFSSTEPCVCTTPFGLALCPDV